MPSSELRYSNTKQRKISRDLKNKQFSTLFWFHPVSFKSITIWQSYGVNFGICPYMGLHFLANFDEILYESSGDYKVQSNLKSLAAKFLQKVSRRE